MAASALCGYAATDGQLWAVTPPALPAALACLSPAPLCQPSLAVFLSAGTCRLSASSPLMVGAVRLHEVGAAGFALSPLTVAGGGFAEPPQSVL
jgi:hypothetical protein